MIIFLDHKDAHNLEVINRLFKEGHTVKTFCLAHSDSDRSDWFRGSYDECIEYLKIDSNFYDIVEVTFKRPGLPFIDRVIWLDQENN